LLLLNNNNNLKRRGKNALIRRKNIKTATT